MPFTPIKDDGGVQAGTRVLTIGNAAGGVGGTTFVAENFNVNRPTKTITRTNENDEPNGQLTYRDFVTGTATLQLAGAATPEPQSGWEFTATIDTAIGAEIFYLSDVGRAESQGSEKKINVTFRKKVG